MSYRDSNSIKTEFSQKFISKASMKECYAVSNSRPKILRRRLRCDQCSTTNHTFIHFRSHLIVYPNFVTFVCGNKQIIIIIIVRPIREQINNNNEKMDREEIVQMIIGLYMVNVSVLCIMYMHNMCSYQSSMKKQWRKSITRFDCCNTSISSHCHITFLCFNRVQRN